LREQLDQQVQFGDIGQVTFGRPGLWLVNAALVFTQFGFCVMYLIFLATTLAALLPSLPDLLVLVLPLVVLIPCSLVRNVRALAPISILADIATLSGFASALVYISVDFSVADSVQAFRWHTAAVFFGTVTASYEGIGTIIPIEGSMSGNRSSFNRFLWTALTLVSLILCSFGSIGYLRYGTDTPQMITQIFPTNSAWADALNILMAAGVLFTFPLQLFPVIQIAEQLAFFGGFQSIQQHSSASNAKQSTPDLSTLDTTEPHLPIDPNLPMTHWLMWKQNILRIVLVLAVVLVAGVFHDYFSYVASLVGSIGGALLSFIMPCAFDLKLSRPHQPTANMAKNILIIMFGIVGGVLGIVVTIWQMVEGT
jgi:solute carrier family 36 (proton-coupled amino acid transporter)